MEILKVLPKIFCPIHPAEFIQKIYIDDDVEKQQLFCVDCILMHKDPTSISRKLINICDLIDTAVYFYEGKRHSIQTSSQPPQEYLDLINHQAEKLEKLNQLIEQEKKKISILFENILQETVKIISETKNAYLCNLDQQLWNLHYLYTRFEKQVKKAYPTEKDIVSLYPDKENLLIDLVKITNIAQLSVFVRGLQADLNENETNCSKNEKENQADLIDLSKELIQAEDISPCYKIGNLQMSDFKTELQSQIKKLLSQMVSLQKPRMVIHSGKNFESNVVSCEEFKMIKEWLPNNFSFQPKLLYRASKHGWNSSTFHSLCDGKKNTLTLIKAQFEGSSSTCTIGGFLDEPWNSNNSRIYSNQAFIFNTTSKIKCPMINRGTASSYNPQFGPTFGEGPDIYVYLGGDGSQKCYVMPSSSFQETKKIVDKPNYQQGGASFTAYDVEVYAL